jgi:hypothetical protein
LQLQLQLQLQLRLHLVNRKKNAVILSEAARAFCEQCSRRTCILFAFVVAFAGALLLLCCCCSCLLAVIPEGDLLLPLRCYPSPNDLPLLLSLPSSLLLPSLLGTPSL